MVPGQRGRTPTGLQETSPTKAVTKARKVFVFCNHWPYAGDRISGKWPGVDLRMICVYGQVVPREQDHPEGWALHTVPGNIVKKTGELPFRYGG
jgi:hypothetical protein